MNINIFFTRVLGILNPIILIAFTYCFPSNLKAQKVFEKTPVSSVRIEYGEVTFYKNLQNNLYSKISFDLELNKNEKQFNYEFYDNKNSLKLDDIVSDESFFIDKKNVMPISLSEFKQQLKLKSFTTLNKDKKYRYTYFLGHQSFFIQASYNLEDNELKQYKTLPFGDFRKIYPKQIDYYFINLGNSRYIAVLLGSDAGVIYNTKKGLKMVADKDLNYQTINRNPIDYNNLNEVTNPKKFWLVFRGQYHAEKKSNNKYVLKNVYNEQVLTQEFDSIYFHHYFFVGKKGNIYKIYNSYLKALPIKNVKSYFTYHNGIHVIQDNKLNKYDINGELLKVDYPDPDNEYCGLQTRSENIVIGRADSIYNGAYYLKVTKYAQGFNNIERDYIITNIAKTAEIKFANNLIDQENNDRGRDAGSNFDLNMLFVRNKGLYGMFTCPIFDFEPNRISDGDSGDNKKTDRLPFSTIELSQLLPIKYDSIYIKNQRIYFAKNGLFGIYALNDNVEYSLLKQESPNYYRVKSKKGKRGWLSFQEKKVFWDIPHAAARR